MSSTDGRVVIKVIADDNEAKKLITTLGELENQIKNTNAKSNNNGNPFKGAEEGATGAFSKIKNLTGALLASQLAMKALSIVSQSMGSAISRFDTMNRFPKMMEQMGFSSEQSERSIKKLAKGIEGLPTRLDEVVSTAQGLTTMTGDLNKATDLTLALNNAFLASGSASGDASRGLTQFQQMLSSGKVDMQSWKTLQETMPLGLQKTAEAFGYVGKSAKSDFYSALKSGEITFDQFGDKLIELNRGVGGFAELAKTGSEGLATSFQNVKTAVVNGLAGIITKVDDMVKKGTSKNIAQNLDSLKGVVKGVFSTINSALTAVSPLIQLALKGFVALWQIAVKLAPALTSLAIAFLAFKVLTNTIAIVSAFTTVLGNVKTMAISVKTTLVGVINTLKAHPWIALASAIAGAVYGIYKWLTRIPKDVQELGDSMGKAKEKTKELSDSVKELVENQDSARKTNEANHESMKKVLDSVSNLGSVSKRTAGETNQLKDEIKTLNEYFGDSVVAIDESTGKLNLSKEAMQAYLDVASKEKELETTRTQLKQLDEKRLEIDTQKITNSKLLENAQKSLTEASWHEFGAKKELKKQIKELEAEQIRLGETEKTLSTQKEGIIQNQKVLYDELGQAEMNLANIVGEAANRRITSLDELSETEKKVAEALKSNYEKIAESATDMFDKINTSSKLTHEEMLENLRHNVQAVSDWATNLESLADKGVNQGMLERLRAMGPQGAGYVAELNTLSAEELNEFNKLFEQAGKEAPENLSKAMSLDKNKVRNGVLDLVTETNNGLTQGIYELNWSKHGNDIVQGVTKGVTEKTEEAKSSVRNMSTNMKDTFKSELGINGASTVFTGFGQNIVQGLANGVLNAKRSAVSQTTAVARDITSSTNNELINSRSGANYAGQMAGAGFADGLEAQRWNVISTARDIAGAVTGTIRSALSIHSPSRVMEEIGEFTGEGMEIGLASKINNLKKLALEMANSAIPSINQSEAQRITNNNNGSMINNNSSNINIEKVEWSGKDDIRKTMEEIGWITGQEGWRLEKA